MYELFPSLCFSFAAYLCRIGSFSVYVCSTQKSPFSLQSPQSAGRTGQHCQLRQVFYMLIWRIISITMWTVLIVHIFVVAKCWTRYSTWQVSAITFCRFLLLTQFILLLACNQGNIRGPVDLL